VVSLRAWSRPIECSTDLLERASARPLVGDVVLYRAGEQFAHAVGGDRLFPRSRM
jgi:hypothetical protein